MFFVITCCTFLSALQDLKTPAGPTEKWSTIYTLLLYTFHCISHSQGYFAFGHIHPFFRLHSTFREYGNYYLQQRLLAHLPHCVVLRQKKKRLCCTSSPSCTFSFQSGTPLIAVCCCCAFIAMRRTLLFSHAEEGLSRQCMLVVPLLVSS